MVRGRVFLKVIQQHGFLCCGVRLRLPFALDATLAHAGRLELI